MAFEFGTWNVRTLYKTGALLSVISQIQKYNISVTAVQETRWHGSGISDMKKHTVLYSGKNKGRHEYGVAFIVGPRFKNNILDYQAINERMCVMRLKMKFYNVAMINIYAPTEETESNEKDEFYHKLERVLDALPSNDVKIILGDFNAKIGKEEEFRSIIGRNSLHDISNDNGRRLIDFAESKNMVVSSTQFAHKNIHKQTWRSPNGQVFNQIDHVLIDKRRASGIQDVRSFRGADGDTDHYLVRARYLCKITRTPRQNLEKIPKIKVVALEEQEIKFNYQQSIVREFEDRKDKMEEGVETCWEELKAVIKRATEENIGYEERIPRNEWYDDECAASLEERNVARKIYLGRPTRIKYKEYQEKRRIANHICRRKKRAVYNKRLEEMEKNFKENNLKQAYKEVNYNRKGYAPKTNLIRIGDEIIGTTEGILNKWKEHFQQLLNTEASKEETGRSIIEVEEMELEPPDRLDVSLAIKAQKRGKAPGIDNIPAELIKSGGTALENIIYTLVKQIWQKEQIPEEWKIGLICPIYKKGDRLNCQNYRGITLLCTVYKIFTYLLRKRLEEDYNKIIGEYQSGFRAGRSTIDQIYTVKGIAEKFWEFDLNLYHLFIDFRTAYDSISREGLYKIMAEQGIHSKMIRLVKMTMSGSKARVKICGGMTDLFEVGSGLKQGDGLAPMLFNLALHWVVKQTKVDLNSTLLYKNAQIVGYADDLDIMGRTLPALEGIYKDLELGAAKVGLHVNERKTKWMIQSRDRQRITIQPNMTLEIFQEVQEFKYLGTILTSNNDELTEVQSRITAANKIYFALKGIMKSNCVHKSSKIRIYKTIIRSILCYASELWTLTKKTEMMLGALERKILRRIFGPVQENSKWRIRYNHELYRLYKSDDIVTHIKLRRLEWAGHVYRMEEYRIPKKILEGTIYGRRPVGRPKGRWLDAVTTDSRNLLGTAAWRRIALDREDWRKKIEEARARFWAVTP